ncbi:transcriptional regulatory protein pro-1, partial [Colletotrichum incanum]
DEGKPRCQRCIDGNFECQYGPRLTFLNKNALTVSPSPKAGDASTPRYSRLQFVGLGASKQSHKDISSSSPLPQKPPDPNIASDTTDATDTPASVPASQTPTPTVLTFQANPQLSDPTVPKPPPLEPSLAPLSHHSPPLTQWRSQSISSIAHESLASPVGKLHITGKPTGRPPNNDAAYETALNVLLSLGNEGTDLAQSPHHLSGSYEGIGVSPKELMSMSPNSARRRRGSGASHVSTSASVSQDRLLQLLRHFRYQVAPWLDLCDMGQTFGLYVPRLAIENEGVLHSLLAVAATAQQADMKTAFNDVEYLKSLAGARPIHAEGVTISDSDLVHLTLWTACQFTSNIPDGWQNPPVMVGDNFWSMALAEATSKTISILSVLIRLELAAALVTGAPISVPEQLHYDPISQPWNSSPIAEKMFQYTIEPLLLCAMVVNFCAGSFHPQSPDLGVRLTPVHRWTMLSDALGVWYTNRAQEFRPMVEIDGDENLFPIILFTNGAAVFANQLHHTAMLLLLQNKPRTLQAAAKKSSSLSPLWHAQRVCGIALNNDRRDSWDLCLVASLYLAAQRMTYEPQQRAILGCFERVKALTGWNVDGFSAKAREDWGLM